MNYKEIEIDFLINKITSKDEIFRGNYTVDPYQNCEFGCLYCDSSQQSTIFIKKNAPRILDYELNKIKKGTIIVGSVHDPYQKIEEEEKITRKILEKIKKYNFSCNILTKSDLVLRDADIISNIKNSSVTLSICSLREDTTKFFEKNVPSPEKRLETVKKLKDFGIKSGIAIIPFLPFITISELDNIFNQAKKKEADFVLYKALELKGDQKYFILKKIKSFRPDFEKRYNTLYSESYLPKQEYLNEIEEEIIKLSKKYKIKNRI